ncbi:MAG: hypothetical protein AAB316_24125, partial [Bacteroidota bacterium]
ESLIAFAKSKGWEVESKDSGFYILKPPPGIFKPTFRVQVPHLENELAYPVMISAIVDSFARMYKWVYEALKNFLSKSPQEIEESLKEIGTTEVEKRKINPAVVQHQAVAA